jgi:hypothetical protein
MISFSDLNGNRFLGTDNGTLRGVCALWNDSLAQQHVQRDDGNCPDTTIRIEGNSIVVSNDAFEEKYAFNSENFEVVMEVKTADLLAGSGFNFYLGSTEIVQHAFLSPSPDLGTPTYKELENCNYITDIATDISSGQYGIVHIRSLDLTAEAENPPVGSPHTGSIHNARGTTSLTRTHTILDGMGIWWYRYGKMLFAEGEKTVFSSPDLVPLDQITQTKQREVSYYYNNGAPDINIVGVELSSTTYVAVQAFENLKTNDVANAIVTPEFGGYEVVSANYLNEETEKGIQRGRIVVPMAPPPEGGYKLVVYNHGAGGLCWNSAFSMDFLGNEGYVVASASYADDSDLEYYPQVRIEELRRYVVGHYPINASRQYVAGLSMGGLNTFLCGVNQPSSYAAMVPQSPLYHIELPFASTEALYPDTITNPRARKEQLTCPISIVCGAEGLDTAILVNQVPLAQSDHPRIVVYVAYAAGHDQMTWTAYRKEIMSLFENNVRSEYQENNVNGLFVGGFSSDTNKNPWTLPLHYSNDWIDVELQNDTYTMINATRTIGASSILYSIKIDQKTTVSILKSESADGITISPNVDFVETISNFQGKAENCITFNADENTQYELVFETSSEGKKGNLGVPGFELVGLIAGLGAAIALTRRRK